MAKLSSNVAALIGRILKAVMAALLVPLIIGLVAGIREGLEIGSFSGGTFGRWVNWGVGSYVLLHTLLYRPAPLFRASHRLFSVIAVWLFGGQVASTEQPVGTGRSKGKGSKAAKGPVHAQGSTLVALSPYVIPLYTVLVCAAAWVLSRWLYRVFVDGPAGFLIGATIAFHWLMTADELQQQRDRWHLETYLLAIGLVFVVTLLIAAACLPLAVPEFSFARALGDGFARAQVICTAVIRRVF